MNRAPLVALAFACAPAAAPQAPVAARSHLASNPVVAENALPAAADWSLSNPSGAVAAYADRTSAAAGESVSIAVSADGGADVTWSLYRLGYYGGGGARLVASGGPVPAPAQPGPSIDAATGLVECAWAPTFALTVDPAWPSGVYLVKVARVDGGGDTYALLVVRDARAADVLVQLPVNTYQAYNEWGGGSLYADSNAGLPHAFKVSYDRPYGGDGTGELMLFDLYMVQWLEAWGYDVTYATNLDLELYPEVLRGRRLFLDIGHDEYWSAPARDALEAAVAGGLNAAFLSADSVYWQVRMEPDAAGNGARTEVCYKDDGLANDPLWGVDNAHATTVWRDPAVGRPENALLGVMSDGWEFVDVPWVVRGAASWLYAGTGLADGDVIPSLVGYESDRRFANGAEPPDLTMLAASPEADGEVRLSLQEAAWHQRPGQGWVFAAGTLHWAWTLARPGVADARVQRMMRNLLAQSGAQPGAAGDTFGAASGWAAADLSAAATSVTTAAAGLAAPWGVAVDGAGAVYVSDATAGTVSRVMSSGAVAVVASQLDGPAGLAADAAGNVYVAESHAGCVRLLAPDGSVATLACGLHFPTGLAATAGGDLYIADTLGNAVAFLPAGGGLSVYAGGAQGFADGSLGSAAFYRPSAVALAPDGTLYVADSGNRAVRRISGGAVDTIAGGAGTTGFGDGAGDAARIEAYGGLAVGPDGAVYASDPGNFRVRRIVPGSAAATTSVSTFAGSGAFGAADGPGGAAQLVLPLGLAFDATGRLWIADLGNGRVRTAVR